MMQTPGARTRERIREICGAYGVEPEKVLSPSRRHALMPARKEVAAYLRNERHMSLGQIAMAMGKRDHTTVIYYLRGHEKKGA
jgi:chromosomal replication initiation ATPase DnaA